MNTLLKGWLLGWTALLGSAPAWVVPAPEQACSAPDGNPKILLSETALDFGKVRQLEEKTLILSFLNDGDGDLRILDIQTDCSCTPLLAERTRYRPGEAGEIEVTFSADLEPGLKEGSFIIHVNDPDQPAVKVKTRGTVEPEYRFEPPILNFGAFRKGDPEKVLRLEIAPVAAQGLNLISARCEDEHIAVKTLSGTFEPGRPVVIEVRLEKEIPPGRFKAQLVIDTDNPRIPTWKIPVIGLVRGDILVYPTLVSFGTVKKGESCSRTIRVSREDASAGLPRVPKVTSPLEHLEARIVPGERENEVRVVLTLRPDSPRGRIDTTLTITTQSSILEHHEVRVFGLVN